MIKRPSIFRSAPGYTLEQLESISDNELEKLKSFETLLKQYQASGKNNELDEFAQYCQTASDRFLYRIISHSTPLKDFLSQPSYETLWHDRLIVHGITEQTHHKTSSFSRWETGFLISQYERWKNSQYANHSMVQPLKLKVDEMIHSNTMINYTAVSA